MYSILNKKPTILKDHWRSENPIIVKTNENKYHFCYYEKTLKKDGQIFISIIYEPHFVCRDGYSQWNNEIIENVVEWKYAFPIEISPIYK